MKKILIIISLAWCIPSLSFEPLATSPAEIETSALVAASSNTFTHSLLALVITGCGFLAWNQYKIHEQLKNHEIAEQKINELAGKLTSLTLQLGTLERNTNEKIEEKITLARKQMHEELLAKLGEMIAAHQKKYDAHLKDHKDDLERFKKEKKEHHSQELDDIKAAIVAMQRQLNELFQKKK